MDDSPLANSQAVQQFLRPQLDDDDDSKLLQGPEAITLFQELPDDDDDTDVVHFHQADEDGFDDGVDEGVDEGGFDPNDMQVVADDGLPILPDQGPAAQPQFPAQPVANPDPVIGI